MDTKVQTTDDEDLESEWSLRHNRKRDLEIQIEEAQQQLQKLLDEDDDDEDYHISGPKEVAAALKRLKEIRERSPDHKRIEFEKLLTDLEAMAEADDGHSEVPRARAEELLTAYDELKAKQNKLITKYEYLSNWMIRVRGFQPEVYAHLYIGKATAD